jgi:hypothetical protein
MPGNTGSLSGITDWAGCLKPDAAILGASFWLNLMGSGQDSGASQYSPPALAGSPFSHHRAVPLGASRRCLRLQGASGEGANHAKRHSSGSRPHRAPNRRRTGEFDPIGAIRTNFGSEWRWPTSIREVAGSPYAIRGQGRTCSTRRHYDCLARARS